jgi:hypothetical protein
MMVFDREGNFLRSWGEGQTKPKGGQFVLHAKAIRGRATKSAARIQNRSSRRSVTLVA